MDIQLTFGYSLITLHTTIALAPESKAADRPNESTVSKGMHMMTCQGTRASSMNHLSGSGAGQTMRRPNQTRGSHQINNKSLR